MADNSIGVKVWLMIVLSGGHEVWKCSYMYFVKTIIQHHNTVPRYSTTIQCRSSLVFGRIAPSSYCTVHSMTCTCLGSSVGRASAWYAVCHGFKSRLRQLIFPVEK